MLPRLRARQSRKRSTRRGGCLRLGAERAGHELSVTSGWPLQYAVCGSEPRVVVLMGRVGSGKSTLACALGRELGWDIFSSDQARKELAGLPLYTRGGPAVRRRLYSKATTRKTYAALLRNARNQVKERHSLILDATFSLRHHRDQLRQQLDRAGVALLLCRDSSV